MRGNAIDVRAIPGMVSLFLELGPTRIRELTQAHAAKDAPRLASVAHAFKGSCLTFRAAELAETCQELETDGERDDLSRAAQLIARLQQQFDALKGTLNP
jgi:HPt (histidine-containing phosphotransfer) domain-containing protein